MTVVTRHSPLVVSMTGIASSFFGIGLLLLLGEALFFRQVSALASTPFSTRTFIAIHLFPSEIWFIALGNSLTAVLLARDRFYVSRRSFDNVKPIFLVLGVYTVWFVYGAAIGNWWALQEFREMVFTAFSLPAILYLAPHVNAAELFKKAFVNVGLLVVPVASLYGFISGQFSPPNSLLMLSMFIATYYLFRILYKNKLAVLIFAIITFPVALKFSKPMVAMLLFVIAATVVLAGHANNNSVRWVLSRFKLRIALIIMVVLALLGLMVFAINVRYDGIIEQAFRLYFLKERFTSEGDIYYGNRTGGRFTIWKAALSAWTEKPLFGYGLGATVEAGPYIKVQFHNYLLQALHNTGLLGTVLIIGAWLVWLGRALESVRSWEATHAQILHATMLIYVFGVLFYGLYGHSLSHPPAAQFFWLCVGFLCVYRRSGT